MRANEVVIFSNSPELGIRPNCKHRKRNPQNYQHSKIGSSQQQNDTGETNNSNYKTYANKASVCAYCFKKARVRTNSGESRNKNQRNA